MVCYVGACGTCPSSTTTMKMGIERVLKEKFGAAMKEIIQVDKQDIGASVSVRSICRYLLTWKIVNSCFDVFLAGTSTIRFCQASIILFWVGFLRSYDFHHIFFSSVFFYFSSEIIVFQNLESGIWKLSEVSM
jgi:hypothetical protein